MSSSRGSSPCARKVSLEQRRSLFARLVAEHQPRLERSLRPLAQRLGLGATVEDVVAESHLRAWKHFDRFDPGGNFAAWVVVIGRRLLLDLARRGRTQPLPPTSDGHAFDLPGREAPPEQVAEYRWRLAAVQTALARRSPRDRRVWELTQRGMAQVDVARQLGLKSTAVAAIRYRIRAAIAAALGAVDGDEGD